MKSNYGSLWWKVNSHYLRKIFFYTGSFFSISYVSFRHCRIHRVSIPFWYFHQGSSYLWRSRPFWIRSRNHVSLFFLVCDVKEERPPDTRPSWMVLPPRQSRRGDPPSRDRPTEVPRWTSVGLFGPFPKSHPVWTSSKPRRWMRDSPKTLQLVGVGI